MSIITGVGSPGTVSLASGGLILAFNAITTTPALILPIDPTRKRITFHNPGNTNDIFIVPGFWQNTGSDVASSATTSLLGGTFRVFANGASLIIEGEVQKSWFAFAAAGSTNPLTVMVSRV